jgi:hypothetical protein
MDHTFHQLFGSGKPDFGFRHSVIQKKQSIIKYGAADTHLGEHPIQTFRSGLYEIVGSICHDGYFHLS